MDKPTLNVVEESEAPKTYKVTFLVEGNMTLCATDVADAKREAHGWPGIINKAKVGTGMTLEGMGLRIVVDEISEQA